MPGAERDGEGNLRGLSVVRLAVEFVAVAQQHAEPKDGNTQNKERHRFFSAAPLYYLSLS